LDIIATPEDAWLWREGRYMIAQTMK